MRRLTSHPPARSHHNHRPRGAWNIPKTGPVIFIAAPHANQFLDPLLLFTEVRKESGRRVSMLTAAKVSGLPALCCVQKQAADMT